ncbi:MAG: hypothetical protein H7A47_07120 [Verrucomicrobiales bacterium]|nr:hypothetical protein [Verrucomicrobiales bacterium]
MQWRAAGLFPALCVITTALSAGQPLWQIGAPDGGDREFALAPGGYADFKTDGCLVIGIDDPKRDWPYVHPGPADAWAGSRRHTFAISFGLRQEAAGEGRLVIHGLDAHSSAPPRVEIDVNGRITERRLSAGGGDASVFGEPAKGRPFTLEIPLAPDVWRAGENRIAITTLAGSWFLYDSVTLEAPVGAELAPVPPSTQCLSLAAHPVWLRHDDPAGPTQPVTLTLRHTGEPADAELRLDGRKVADIHLERGTREVAIEVPAANEPRASQLAVVAGGVELTTAPLPLQPPAIREIWILPHSHVDVGYTHRQDEVIDIQIGNLEQAMALSKASAANPPEERFKWNPEAVWVLDHFLNRATPAQREAFVAAVRAGDVGLDALYGNMLTALCRPEELAQCLTLGSEIAELTGVPFTTAAICDVPGWTWGLVSVLQEAGVKYFAAGPNFSARIGTIHTWANRPFYWRSPSGKQQVLTWVVDNYHHFGTLADHVLGHIENAGREGFPYDMSFLFWVGRWPNGGVDNAPPDEALVQQVMDWNRRHATPRLVIGLTGDFMRRFEERHGGQVPVFSGDLTPYWEDGAGSTARETAMNRASAERLSQATALLAMRQATHYPADAFRAAWKNVLLYSEHTWGAWNSISDPDHPFVLDQWRVKQAFALDADRESRALLADALPAGPADSRLIDVFNTTQWPRTELAVVSPQLAGLDIHGVEAVDGTPVPSQRLASDELVFLAEDVPGFGARRYRLLQAANWQGTGARITENGLSTSTLHVGVDPTSGAIETLRLNGLEHEFVDAGAPVGLNDYRYVLGADAAGAQTNGPVALTVVDDGPLVATMRLESAAPGCRRLFREVRVIEGLNRVEIVNHVDREAVREKDSVHFGFGFNVPGGVVRMETPWAVVRPNVDQLPGSCFHWFTVQRWMDVSSADRGILWAPVDAPLVEIGGMTANLMGAVGYNEWRTNAMDSTTLYSWAQNNHWFTNYKADQPGVTTFRYALLPHAGGYAPEAAARFGMATTRPLLVTRAQPAAPLPGPLLRVASSDVLVETAAPTPDGRALLLRLFGLGEKPAFAKLEWTGFQPASVWRADLAGNPVERLDGPIVVPGHGLMTLRVER